MSIILDLTSSNLLISLVLEPNSLYSSSYLSFKNCLALLSALNQVFFSASFVLLSYPKSSGLDRYNIFTKLPLAPQAKQWKICLSAETPHEGCTSPWTGQQISISSYFHIVGLEPQYSIRSSICSFESDILIPSTSLKMLTAEVITHHKSI